MQLGEAGDEAGDGEGEKEDVAREEVAGEQAHLGYLQASEPSVTGQTGGYLRSRTLTTISRTGWVQADAPRPLPHHLPVHQLLLIWSDLYSREMPTAIKILKMQRWMLRARRVR